MTRIKEIYLPYPISIDPDNGRENGGTNVTIKGRNFGLSKEDLIAVYLHTVPCNFTYVSGELITCITGPKPGGGKGNVVIKTISGVSQNSNLQYTYNIAPTIDGIDPDNGPIHGGTSVTITGKHFGEAKEELESISLSNIKCSRIRWINGKQVHCISGAVPFQVSIKGVVEVVTTTGGSGKSSLNYTYNPMPWAASIYPNNGSFLGGTLVVVQGFNLGKSLSDLLYITIAGVNCTNISIYKEYFHGISYKCITGPVPNFSDQGPISGPVIVATISGGEGVATDTGTAEYTYNPPPYIIEVFPLFALANTPTQLRIQGKWLGHNSKDVTDVTVAGRSCNLIYKTDCWLECITHAVGQPLTGPVQIVTRSGGTSTSSFNFTFLPQCEMYKNHNMCETNRCAWCQASSSCVDFNQICPSSCFLYTTKDSCNLMFEDPYHPCTWCPTTSTCLEYERKTVGGHGQVISDCPQSCRFNDSFDISCGSIIIFFLWIILFLIIIGGFWLLIYFIHRDDQFASSLKRMTTRLHPKNLLRRKQKDDLTAKEQEHLLSTPSEEHIETQRALSEKHVSKAQLDVINDVLGLKKQKLSVNTLAFSKLRESVSKEEEEKDSVDEEDATKKLQCNYNRSGRSSIKTFMGTNSAPLIEERKLSAWDANAVNPNNSNAPKLSTSSSKWRGGAESPDASLLSRLVEQQLFSE